MLITLKDNDRDLIDKAPSSTLHPRVYQYTGSRNEYRIGQWMITDKNGTQVYDDVNGTALTGKDAENYHFMIVYRD